MGWYNANLLIYAKFYVVSLEEVSYSINYRSLLFVSRFRSWIVGISNDDGAFLYIYNAKVPMCIGRIIWSQDEVSIVKRKASRNFVKFAQLFLRNIFP